MPSMLITGAAGFIGNAACARYKDRYKIIGIDDMSRPTARVPEGIHAFYKMDFKRICEFERVDVVLHLAAQVSVIQSLRDPFRDFQNNAEGTLALCLWAKRVKPRTVIYSNTNKVFGELIGQSVPVWDDQPLHPQTPYGVSKACGGMYVRDLLPNSGYDFRQSCIYGEDQQSTEDQGWVGFLRRQIAMGDPITCYGDGSQVRDLMHVQDLLRVYDQAIEGKLHPGSYTVGGGKENALSFQEVVKLLGSEINRYAPWRPHDQRYFVSANQGIWGSWANLIKAREWLANLPETWPLTHQ